MKRCLDIKVQEVTLRKSTAGRKIIKSCCNPKNEGLQQLYGIPERTLTSDLSLRSLACRMMHNLNGLDDTYVFAQWYAAIEKPERI